MSEPNETDILMNGEEWFAKNRGMLINITLVILVVVVGMSWMNNNKSASSSKAESDLVKALSLNSTNLNDVASRLNDVHANNKGEPVAQRALILSAKTSLDAGNIKNAKARFSTYLTDYADGNWVDEAKLGEALCWEADGDVDKAIATYQSLTDEANEKVSDTIRNRAAALLEAAQTELDPLPSRPEPVVEPETPPTGVISEPAKPDSAPDTKPAPVAPPAETEQK